MRTALALGHTFDLSLEREIFADSDITLVDGKDDYDPAQVEGILLGTALQLDRAKLAEYPNLKGVMRFGIGYDNVDVAAASDRGITVGIVRDYCVEEVAEHALTSALSLLRALPHWDRNLRAGSWRAGARPRHRRISGLCFGVMGYGLIGREVARKASGLFGEVLIFDPMLETSDNTVDGFPVEPDLGAFLSRVDALTLHAPLTDSTRGIIGDKALRKMRNDAVVINASRGGLVDEAALARALEVGEIAGAAIDTFTTEPINPDNPLLHRPEAILTPHVAWLSEEAEVALRQSAAQDLLAILSGARPNTPVN
ncbi:MAG: 3-phosphoglycerate dehydrogenase [Mameliella sp.]|nr:3-phosphoglycerate dehydrogenase [Mameliella sp.]